MPAATDVANSVDVAALAGVIILAAGVVTASRTLWTVSRKWTTFTDLLKRELTGWQDEATGEVHPSLRSELKDAHQRLTEVEQATRQLRPNGGSHLADAIRQTDTRLEQVEYLVHELIAAQARHVRKTPRVKKEQAHDPER
jgi:hypothetical protein